MTGTLVSQLRYLPYGETRWSSGPFPTDRRFTGQREEVTLGVDDYGARLYAPGLGRFLSADTLVPEAGRPQSLNRYMYTLGNPLRYTDPSGHLSEEELNWLGYYSDSVDEDTWNLLLTLQPGDWMLVCHPNQGEYPTFAGRLGIARRYSQKPDQPEQFGLFVFGDRDGKPTELLEWIGNDLDTVSVNRNTPDGYGRVWEEGKPDGMWSTPIAQRGYVQTERGATNERLFSVLVATLLTSPSGLFDKGWIVPLLVDFYFALSLDPGTVPGDVHMSFTYYDEVNETYYTRSMWLRPKSQSGPMPIISDTWFEGLP